MIEIILRLWPCPFLDLRWDHGHKCIGFSPFRWWRFNADLIPGKKGYDIGHYWSYGPFSFTRDPTLCTSNHTTPYRNS